MAIGTLAVRVSANTRPFQRGMRGTRGPMRQLERQAGQVARRVGFMTAAVTAAGTAIGVSLVSQGLEAVDAQSKLARRLDTTVSSIQTLTRAAELAGIEQQRLERSLEAMNRRLGEAQEGTGQAADTLEKLNLNADELARMPLDERMQVIGAAINGLGTSTERAAAAADLFSRSGISMLTLFENGGAAIRTAAEEVERFNVAVSDTDAQRIEAANDALTRIGFAATGVRNAVTAELAPTIEAVASEIADQFGEAGEDMKEGVEQAVDAAVEGFADVLDAAAGVLGFIEENPATAQFGVLGFILFGRKGAALGAAVGALFEGVREQLADLGIGISEAEDNARQLASVQEQIAQREREIAEARRRGLDPGEIEVEQGASLLDLLEELRDREVELTAEVESNAEAFEHFNRLMDETAGKGPAVAEAIRDIAQAMRESREVEEVETPQALPNVDLTGDDDEDSDEVAKTEERRREMQRRLELLRAEAEGEAALEQERFEQRMERLREQFETEQGMLSEFDKVKEQLEEQHQQRLNEIERRGLSEREKFERASMQKRVSIVAGQLEQMTASVARENKAMFRLNQIAGIANATINAWEGFNQALSAYPPPLSYAMAAAQLAAGMSAVNQIRSQSFSAGGGAPSRSGTTPVTPQPGPGESGAGGGEEVVRRTEVTLNGLDDDAMFSGRQVRRLIERINDEVDGGMVIRAA